MANTSPWLHRRVEKVSYRRELLIRRQISIDFTIPGGLMPFAELASDEKIYYAPLSLLRKWPPLLNLDLRSEADVSVPLLTTRKNREVDSRVLIALAPEGGLKAEVRQDLIQIPYERPERAKELFDVVGRRIAAAQDTLGEDETAWVKILVLAGDLVQNSILWFRTKAYPDKRQVVKFAFDEPVPGVTGNRVFLASLGWVPDRAWFSIPHLGDGGSYHFQFEPPEGSVVLNANFQIEHPWEPPEPTAEKPFWTRAARALKRGIYAKWDHVRLPGKPEKVRRPAMTHADDAPLGQPYVWNSEERAYLYVSGRRKHYGLATFDLAVDSRAFPTAALVAGLSIALLLTVVARAADSIVVPDQLGTAVTILLLVPGLLGYLVIRPNEHPFVAARLRGVRRVVLLSGALAVIAAIVLLVEQSSNVCVVRGWWTGLAVTAWILTLILGLSWLLPGPDYPDED